MAKWGARANDIGAWKTTSYSPSLRKNRSARDTAPELLLRKSLHRLGVRFRLHQRIGDRLTVDLVLPRYHIAVFVDGCFWHGCPLHGRAVSKGPNQKMWSEKLASVKQREARAARLLSEARLVVIRLWECSILADPEFAAAEIIRVTTGLPFTLSPAPGPVRRRCRRPPAKRMTGKWLR